MAISKDLKQAIQAVEATVIVDDGGNRSDKPDYECPDYKAAMTRVSFMRACYGGTRSMRAQGDEFLPRFSREEPDDYDDRLRVAVGYNAVKRTVKGLVGMVFRKDVDTSEVNTAIQPDLEDVDLMGNDLHTFAKRVSDDAWLAGYSWIFVDAPERSPEVRSLADERAMGIRPYWIHAKAEEVINWRWRMERGRSVLALWVRVETNEEPDGEFGVMSVTRYRVLRHDEGQPVSYQLWELDDTAERREFKLVGEGTVDAPEIPVVRIAANEDNHFDAEPPLEDVAHLQVAHYRRHSSYDRALDFAVPMPVFWGAALENIEFGADRAVVIPSDTAGAMLLEMQGAAMGANRDQLKDFEQRMAALGLSMLVRETRAAETAEAKRMDKGESDSALAAFARSLESSLNQALFYHAQYKKIQDAGTVSVNRDFENQEMTPQMVQVLSSMVALKQLREETLWQMMIRGEVLPENFDPDMESELLALGSGGMLEVDA